MEKFLAEAQTAYFWIVVIGIQLIIGFAVNFSMRPLDTVFGTVSKKWKARAEKRWENLRDFANRLNDPDYRNHIMWLERTNASQRLILLLYAVFTLTGAALILHFNPRAGGPLTATQLFAFALAAFSLWCVYLMMQASGAMFHQQAAIKLHEDFRQILLQARKDDEAKNASIATGSGSR